MIGMLVQTLYFLVDLTFVSRLDADALAGVSAAGNEVMIVVALTQMLSVGTVALISHAVGAGDPALAQLGFNPSLSLALLCTPLSAACSCAHSCGVAWPRSVHRRRARQRLGLHQAPCSEVHQRNSCGTRAAPAAAGTRIPSEYQTSTKSGESSEQCST